MKKIILLLITIILVITCYVESEVVNEIYFDNIYKNNTTEFSLLKYYPSEVDENGYFIDKQKRYMLIDIINEFSVEFGVEVSHTIYQNADTIVLMTTDTTFSNKFPDKIEPIYPKTNVVLDEPHTKFNLPTNNYKYLIYPMEYLPELTHGVGKYIVTTIDPQVVDVLLERLNETIGTVSLEGIYSYNLFVVICNYLIEDILPVFILMLICIILGIFILIKLCVSKAKVISILYLNGYSNIKIIQYFLHYLTPSLLLSLLIACIINSIYICAQFEAYFILYFLIATIILFLLITLAVLSILALLVSVIVFRYNKKDLVEGKVVFSNFNFMQMIVKYTIILFSLFIFSNILTQQQTLAVMLQANEHWEVAQNVYKLLWRPDSVKFMEQRKDEPAYTNIYVGMEQQNDAILLDTNAYLDSDIGMFLNQYEIVYSWEAASNLVPDHIKKELLNKDEMYKELWSTNKFSYQHKNLVVNTNYLNQHPIITIDNNCVIEDLIYEDLTLNILVPEILKYETTQIVEDYKDLFYFQKVQVPEIYGEQVDVSIEELNINVIYIKDNQEFFTYNSETGLKTNNLIFDNPIIVVDTNNFDYNYYTPSKLFFRSSKANPMEDVRELIENNGLSRQFSGVKSIYNERAEEIDNLIKNIRINMFVFLFTLGCTIIFTYVININYFEQNRYKIFVKYSLGFSLPKILQLKVGIDILLYLIILLYFDIPLFYQIILFVLDLGTNALFNYRIFSKSINEVIKGGL